MLRIIINKHELILEAGGFFKGLIIILSIVLIIHSLIATKELLLNIKVQKYKQNQLKLWHENEMTIEECYNHSRRFTSGSKFRVVITQDQDGNRSFDKI